mmetsp:Transcript_38222/g.91890  ORF Transcript_38222/g.91890 Transcript_38222/m.91890 type:complete len:212 (-) Transcript_38222:1095-1730(-)
MRPDVLGLGDPPPEFRLHVRCVAMPGPSTQHLIVRTEEIPGCQNSRVCKDHDLANTDNTQGTEANGSEYHRFSNSRRKRHCVTQCLRNFVIGLRIIRRFSFNQRCHVIGFPVIPFFMHFRRNIVSLHLGLRGVRNEISGGVVLQVDKRVGYKQLHIASLQIRKQTGTQLRTLHCWPDEQNQHKLHGCPRQKADKGQEWHELGRKLRLAVPK